MTPLREASSTNAQFLLEFNKSLNMPHHRVTMIDYTILCFYEKKKGEDKYAKFQPSIFTETLLTECHGASDAQSLSCLSKVR